MLRLVTQAGSLASAVALAAAAVRKKGVVADDTTLRATCSDAIAITGTASATVHEPGQFAVSADQLIALVAGFVPGSLVTLSTTENTATIVCGNSRSRLPILPWADLPDELGFDAEIANVKVSGDDCLTLLSPLPAAAKDRTQFFLCGIFLHTIGDQLVAVCTDGVRLIRVGVSAAEFSTTRDLILPQEAAIALRWLITRTKPDKLTLRRSQTLLAASGPGFEFISRLIDFKFPHYERCFPAASPNFISCARSELIAALTRLRAVATAEPPLVVMTWADTGSLKLFLARQPDDGADAIAAQAHGTARVAVPLSQLAAMINEFSGERIRLDASEPLVIRSEGDKLALLMPSAWKFGP